MKTKTYLWAGVLAPVVYAFTVLLGGALHPRYSHLAQAVSDLIATGAPNKALLDPLFGLYNLLTLAAGWGVWRVARAASTPRRGVGLAGALLLMLEGLLGLATLFFPEDAGGLGAIGPTGTLHIVFAGLSSLATMLTMLLLGLWWQAGPARRGLAVYSFVSVLVVFVSGGMAAYGVANAMPWAGLAERSAIGGFLQWLLVIGWQLTAAEAERAGQLKPAAGRV
jgi:hypothetical membrane protein